MSSLAWIPRQTNKAANAPQPSLRNHTKYPLKMKRDMLNDSIHLLELSRFRGGGDLEVGGGPTAVQKKGGGAAWTLHSETIYSNHTQESCCKGFFLQNLLNCSNKYLHCNSLSDPEQHFTAPGRYPYSTTLGGKGRVNRGVSYPPM